MALRPVYTAPSADAAAAALDDFERGPHVIPFFAFPPDVRRLIYTTNSLESVHAQLRKIINAAVPGPTAGLRGLRTKNGPWTKDGPRTRHQGLSARIPGTVGDKEGRARRLAPHPWVIRN